MWAFRKLFTLQVLNKEYPIDSTVLILRPAIWVHVSGQVAISLHLTGHKTNESAGLILIAAILSMCQVK
jgi:hypothetical protein